MAATDDLNNLEKWASNATSQLESIASQLAEIESSLDKLPEDDVCIMELLETAQDIQKEHACVLSKVMEIQKKNETVCSDVEFHLGAIEKLFGLLKLKTEGSN